VEVRRVLSEIVECGRIDLGDEAARVGDPCLLERMRREPRIDERRLTLSFCEELLEEVR
jgi:hypothetical protein